MKRNILFLFIVFTFTLYSNEILPIVIENQEFIYNKLSKTISNSLPKRIEILVFDLFLLNGKEEVGKKLNDNFRIIMKNKQYIYNYSLFFYIKFYRLHFDYLNIFKIFIN